MRIEALCTGDELLTGLTVDTNSAFFTERALDQLGEQVRLIQVVGDVRADIVAAIRAAAERSDAVLVSGGLGPTTDDLTAECAAAAQGVPLVEDEATLDSLRARFAAAGFTLTSNNLRQALVPRGAEVIQNPVGSAPMFIQRIGACTLFYVPGVPREYRHLVEHEVLPRLAALLASAAPAGEGQRRYRELLVLKTIGLPESHLDMLLRPVMPAHPEVVFGFRTHAPENHVKLCGVGDSPERARSLAGAAGAAVRELLGEACFGEGAATLPGVVGELLRSRGQTVAVAESCTGGAVCELLTREPGASATFRGGLVTYDAGLKTEWAGVDADLVGREGAVSSAVAVELARGARGRARADHGIGVTGFAGPTGGTPTDPVGTVYVAVASAGACEVRRSTVPGDRERVRRFAAYGAVDLLRRSLLEKVGASS